MTDREILDLFHSGAREKAFTLLMEKYQQRVYFHIRRMVKSHDDADDVDGHHGADAQRPLPAPAGTPGGGRGRTPDCVHARMLCESAGRINSSG